MSVYTQFDPDDIVKGNPTEVTTGLWTNGTGSLSGFYTSSQTTGSSGQYYWDIYNLSPSGSNSAIQFAVAYGHRLGGGHPTLDDDDNSTLATKVTYSQYRNLLLDPDDTQFTFAGNWNSDHIYVINISRALMKERLDPGNWQLKLSGSNGLITLIDDSGQSLGSQFGKSGAVFNVASGALSGSSGSVVYSISSSTKGGYGLFYPSVGIIVLNPDAITSAAGFTSGSYYTAPSGIPFAPVTTSQTTPQYNHAGLVRSMRGGGDFQARSAENISSTHYFVRLRNKELNYTNNPTFFDETNGQINQVTFINDPRTYVTTIGLYNADNELVAIAKLSKPVQKSFSSELLIRARLDW